LSATGHSANAKKKAGSDRVLPKLTKAEEDLLWHMEHGYQLETDLLGSNPVLHRLKDDEVIRPASANRNTVKALEEHGLIVPDKGRDALTVVWRIRGKSKKIVSRQLVAKKSSCERGEGVFCRATEGKKKVRAQNKM
jgi:hypothetical protein